MCSDCVVMFWWYVDDALVLCWWCLCSVSVMLWCPRDGWWCCGDVWSWFVMFRWRTLMSIFRFSVGSDAKSMVVPCVFAIGVVCWANFQPFIGVMSHNPISPHFFRGFWCPPGRTSFCWAFWRGKFFQPGRHTQPLERNYGHATVELAMKIGQNIKGLSVSAVTGNSGHG